MTSDFNFADKLPGNPIKQWIYAYQEEGENKWLFFNTDRDFRHSYALDYGFTFVPVGLFVGVCFNDTFNADYSICSFDESSAFSKKMAEKIAYGRATEGMTRKRRAKSRVYPDIAELYYKFIERCERYYKGAEPSERVLNAKRECEKIIEKFNDEAAEYESTYNTYTDV